MPTNVRPIAMLEAGQDATTERPIQETIVRCERLITRTEFDISTTSAKDAYAVAVALHGEQCTDCDLRVATVMAVACGEQWEATVREQVGEARFAAMYGKA